MKYFTMPSDFKFETIDSYVYLNEKFSNSKLVETYGQITTEGITNSGRFNNSIPPVSPSFLRDYIEYSKKNGIDFSYTFNASCLGNYEFTYEGIRKIKDFVKELKYVGVNNFTVASPLLIEIILKVDQNTNIIASTICEINSVSKVLFYKKLGVKRIVVDADVNRNFKLLGNIVSAFGEGVEVIINNVCMKNCAYKIFHYNHDSHASDSCLDISYYSSRCAMQKLASPDNILKLNWIRPEDIKYYDAMNITHFKIQGRPNVLNGNPSRTLYSYFNENFDGNLCELLVLFSPNIFPSSIDNKSLNGFLDPFVANSDFCNELCDDCGYCSIYAEKSMDFDKVQKSNQDFICMFKSIKLFEGV